MPFKVWWLSVLNKLNQLNPTPNSVSRDQWRNNLRHNHRLRSPTKHPTTLWKFMNLKKDEAYFGCSELFGVRYLPQGHISTLPRPLAMQAGLLPPTENLKWCTTFLHLIPFTWKLHYLSVCKQICSALEQVKLLSFYLVWPSFASHRATHLPRMQLIRLLTVACGVLVHSASLASMQCRCRSRTSQTYLLGDISLGEYADHAGTGMFSASRNRVQIFAAWGSSWSRCNMRWWPWMNGTTMIFRILSL